MPGTRRKPSRSKKKLAARLRPPDMPVATAVHEARLLADAALPHKKRMAKLPDFDPALLDALPRLAAALEERERAWVMARAKVTRNPRGPVREKALRLRSEIVADARYVLRSRPLEMKQLDEIGGSKAIASLASDLRNLARLVSKHAARFACSPTLPADAADQASLLADQLSTAPRGAGVADEPQRDRNEAFWQLAHAVSEVRAAARYLFRHEPAILAEMTSGYLGEKQKRRRARKRGSAVAPTAEQA